MSFAFVAGEMAGDARQFPWAEAPVILYPTVCATEADFVKLRQERRLSMPKLLLQPCR
ncbi:MAG TPA: hypothetical protein VK035_02765 [Kiloniellales bacterium]|nr:hypothetical protein [Kiloniellales bacterium]